MTTAETKNPLTLAKSITKYLASEINKDDIDPSWRFLVKQALSKKVEEDIIYIVMQEIAKKSKEKKLCQNSKLKSKQ